MEFFDTKITEAAVARVNQVLASTFVSAGKVAAEFEQALADQLGLRNPVTVNSGTAALHLGLAVAGVGAGDEVILPPQTFVATGLAILMQGAKPVFVDIQSDTGNIDPRSVEAAVTARTKAVMPVHWGGYPCDMDEINAIAAERGLAVVEDAAHALGAEYKGRKVGTLSAFTAFSFQAIKHMTAGDGGALCCDDDGAGRLARRLRWFGIDREGSKPSELGERVFDIDQVGFKYHMNDVAAAIGLGNMTDFDGGLMRRREIAARYREELPGVPGLRLLDYRDDRQSAYWLFTLRVERRGDFIAKMRSAEIPVSVVHQRIDRFSVFGGLTPGLSNQELFDEEQIALPVHPGLGDGEVAAVIEAIRTGW